MPVAATLGPLGPVPASWMPPAGTPALQAGPDVPYGVDRPAGLTFQVFLIYGRHTLNARYRAVPTAVQRRPLLLRAALLAAWRSCSRPHDGGEGFGDIAVTVRVPPGWPAAVRPALVRTGDALTGHFDGIPADAIGVTTRMPLPPDWTQVGWVVSVSVVVIVGLIAVGCSAVGAAGRRFWAWHYCWSVSPRSSSPFLEQMRSDSVPPGQMSWWGAKGVGFAAIAHTLVAFVVGLILSQVALAAGATTSAAGRKVRHASR